MTDELLKAVARKLAAASGYDPDGTWEEFDRNAAATVTNCGDYEGWQDDVFPKFIRWHEFVPQADAALSLMQPEIDRRVAEERKAQDDRIDALEAALRDVFIHGHSEGWHGNQMRRDVKHEDAEKSWSLYVSKGALEKTKARHRTTSLAAQEVDSGMSGDAVERAKWFWANLPTGRKWAGLATHEKALVCHQIARITPSLAAQDDWTAKRVAELMAEGDGHWRSCTGCHETNEGAETGYYPFNPVFKTYQGGGCGECGGIGVVWDNTDYADYAEFCLNADDDAPSLAAQDGLVEALEWISKTCDEEIPLEYNDAMRKTFQRNIRDAANKALSAIKEQHHD